jgi:hypothetical protein
MKSLYKKLSAWMILVGLFLQISTPVVAAVQSSSLSSSDIISEKSGVQIKYASEEASESVDVADFNVQALIEQIVADAVEQGCENKLSTALMCCYKSVSEGETVLDVDTLIEAMPELLEYATLQEKLRALRPDISTNNVLPSCNGGCDLSGVIRLLSSIRERIGSVKDGACCNSILGILGDACNVPCIGENSSISEVLCEILNKIELFPSFTFLVTGTFILTVTVDLSEVIDLLIDIENTLTECCAEIKQEIFDTQTLIIDDFQSTWTILAGLDLNCSTTVEIDLNGMFTVLEDIKSDVFDTQTLIIDDFQSTWTILAGLALNCSTTVEIDLNGVFTVLANLDLNCSTTVEIDLNGVFTVLADIENTLTECCAQIHEDFEGTWTILAGLALNCSTTVEIDLNGVFTALANLDLNCSTTVMVDLSGIFTVLADIENKLDLFPTVTFIVTGTFILTVTVDLSSVYTMIEDCCACGPIPLFQSDVNSITNAITLSTPGLNYCLAENITATIIITGANVMVDGNDRVLNGRIYINAPDVIAKDIKVKTPAAANNGEAAFAGIQAMSAASRVHIINCLVECADSVVSINARTGIYSNAANTVIEGCNVISGDGVSDGYGILLGSINGSIINSTVTVTGQQNAYGIFIIGTNGSIINSTATATGQQDGYGILLGSSHGSIINSTVTVTGQQNGYGILLGSSHGLIENSTATATGQQNGYGIYIVGSATSIVKSCLVVEVSGLTAVGIEVGSGSSDLQINECKINNVTGNGIRVQPGSSSIQVISNRVSSCSSIGVNNLAGTESTFYNNIVTDCSPNYSGVPLIRVPGPQTGFFTNVTQGEQDCDLCDVYTVLSDCCACGPIPLFQSDVAGGVISLAAPGLNYCLAENITGNIIVIGANITIDGNDRVLTGRVYINAADVILKNTKIKTPSATNNPEALNAGVEVTVNGGKAQILNCLVECADSVVTVNARNGIHCVAGNIIVEQCNVTGGNGSSVGAGIFIVGNNGLIKNSTGNGKGDSGYGIIIAGDNGHIENSNGSGTNSDISYGIYVQGNAGLIRNSIGTAAGGFNDYGVYIIGNNGLIENSIGTATGTVISYGIFIEGNNGLIENSIGNGTGDLNGFGISIDGNFGLIKSSVGTAVGNSNGYGIYLLGDNSSIISSSGTGTRTEAVAGTYGAGIYLTGNNGLIEDSTAKGLATNDGYGIFISGNAIVIKACSVIGGGSIAGIYMESNLGTDIQICDCKIDHVDGVGIFASQVSCMQIFNTQVLSSGSVGYFISGESILVQGCSAVCNASHGFRCAASSEFNLNNVTALNNASDGISMLNCDRFQIRNCHSEANGAAGFSLSSPSNSEGVFLSNSAHLNATYGFSNDPVNIIFVNNIATNNSVGDYGGTNPPTTVAISNFAGYWSNVRP